ARLDTFLQRLRLMRRPFELAVHLARGGKDRDLADARGKTRLEAQVTVERACVRGRLRAVEPDPGRTLQAGDRCARRRCTVVVSLAGLIQIFAFRQRQTKPRLGVDVGWHARSHTRRRTGLRESRLRAGENGGGPDEAN